MRRSHVSILVLVLAFGLALAIPPAGASLPRVPPRLTSLGLIRNPDGLCAHSLYQLRTLVDGRPLCTHGPDPVPMGAVTHGNPSVGLMQARAGNRPNDVPCVDNGQSGDRVQAIYVWATGQPDRLGSLLPSLQTYAADVEATVEQSSGGQRQFRWVTTPNGSTCQPSFLDLQVPAADIGNFNAMVSDVMSQGYKLKTRKYLIWVDYPGPMQDDTYCGIGTKYRDDSPDPNTNLNNGYAPEYAGIQPTCWGLRSTDLNGSIEAHELMHTLGAVQDSAPHSTGQYLAGAGHCTDDYDVMCYKDTSGVAPTIVCPNQSSEDLYDCNSDDYFNPNPTGSNYLVNHWNTANSSWMINPNQPTHTLSVTFVGPGSGNVSGGGLNCTSSCSSPIAEGTVVHLTATPASGSSFIGWSGAGCSGTGSCSVTMSGDQSVTATFGTRPRFQPDLLLKGSTGSFIGDNLYNGTGAGQSLATSAPRGAQRVFYFLMQNDGASKDTIDVYGPGNSSGFKVSYTAGSTHFGSPLSVYIPGMFAGGFAPTIKIVVTVLAKAAHGATKSITIKAVSRSSHSAVDVVKAKVTVP